MNAKRTMLRSLLLIGALAGMVLGSAEAQVAFRSATSAFTATGSPTTPAFRSSSTGVLKTGANRFYTWSTAPTVTPTVRGSWRDGSPTFFLKSQILRTLRSQTAGANYGRPLQDINPGHVMM